MNGFDGPLVGGVDGQPPPANPHGYWVLCCYQAPIKRRKERFRARNSPENARVGGKRNTATWPKPAPILASAADKEKASARLASSNWWCSLTENQTHISAVSQPRSEALRPSRDSGEGFRATAHAHDCKFREADWHSQLPQLPGNLGAATWLSSRLSP